MGKSGAILGIIGLILGAGGLGLGGFMWLSLSRVENQVDNISEQSTWNRYNATTFSCNPASSYIPCYGLTIEFQLRANESVYFNFMATAHLEPSTGWSQIFVYFRVNGLLYTSPYATVGLYNGGLGTVMITLQQERYDYSLGEHNVTVVIYGTSTGNYIYRSSLFVEKNPM